MWRAASPCRWLVFLGVLVTGTVAGEAGDTLWLRVDSQARTLSVMQGDDVLQVYANISLGRGGTTSTKRQGDERTPLGEYHVSRVSYNSVFHIFIGLDYPTLSQAERAWKDGQLTKQAYLAIRRAHKRHREPPQNTPLGGYIGIHGVGKGDPQIHATVNWTSGCVALTNAQIEDLDTWVSPGMRVVIR